MIMNKCQLCKEETDVLFTVNKKNKEYQACRKCLEEIIYKQRKKVLKKWIRSRKGGNMKIAKILAIAGIIMIVLGMTLQTIGYQRRITEQEKQITYLKGQLDQVASENNRLKAENESLWNNYYMNVTNQEGYEYYE